METPSRNRVKKSSRLLKTDDTEKVIKLDPNGDQTGRASLFHSPGVDISRLDGVKEKLSHPNTLHVDEVGLEQSLRGLKPLPSHLDHTAIWQLRKCGRDNMKKRRRKITLVMVKAFGISNNKLQL